VLQKILMPRADVAWTSVLFATAGNYLYC